MKADLLAVIVCSVLYMVALFMPVNRNKKK
jgi:hypothetical protein